MIIGVFLRHIKTYKGINYIPITDEDKFCGLVGENGVGKSSILEALDCYFNGKSWNFNSSVKRSGLKSTGPYITPVFLISKDIIPESLRIDAEKLSNFVTDLDLSVAAPSVRKFFQSFVAHRDQISRNLDINNYYLLPIGIDYEININLSIFNNRAFVECIYGEDYEEEVHSLSSGELTGYSEILDFIKKTIDYIYIPKEIDPELFTRLETQEIQVLMGETLHEILSERVPEAKIREINSSLNDFIKSLSGELVQYAYRTPSERQQNLRKADLYNLIIQAFFNIRKLHKEQNGNWLEISQLSSGEKQKAIIDIAHSLLKKHRSSGDNLIIAIDEPESSLHMSACYDQFDSLFKVSRDCMQVIFSTHWYGFFPTIEVGSSTIISRRLEDHHFDLINLYSYREQIKQNIARSNGQIPHDIRIKSTNDFVQSVISSTLNNQPFNWLICEGSSEKIYLTMYLKDLVEDQRLRIIPVGGAKEIRRFYNHIATAYNDFRNEIKGNIFLLSDTDHELVDYEVEDFPNLRCCRMVSDPSKEEIKLVKIQSNPKGPKTEIEDALSGPLFQKTMSCFESEAPDVCKIISEQKANEEKVSCFAFDLRQSESSKLDDFFNHSNMKFRFAKTYANLKEDGDYIPSWITELRTFFTPKLKKAVKRKGSTKKRK
tara:strand:- start:746 stop:2722 length:1977 start_codon:yes stop_codon:yes gene_type:complete